MTKLLPPDIRDQIRDHQRRIEVLERRQRPAPTGRERLPSVWFSYAGTLTASTSPPARVAKSGNLAVLAVTLGIAGSTDTTLDVLRNGSSIATLTIPSGTTVFDGYVSVRYAGGTDILELQITDPGTGVADMSAEARFT